MYKTQIINILVNIIDLVGIIVIVRGVAKGAIMFLQVEKDILQKKRYHRSLNNIRCSLASYFLLGLEFMVASDIIAAIIKPDTQHLLHLGVLVIIRIIIGYFLNRELKETNTEIKK